MDPSRIHYSVFNNQQKIEFRVSFCDQICCLKTFCKGFLENIQILVWLFAYNILP